MGPLMGRIQSELLGPMLNRVFNILWRQGKYPRPPEQAQGQQFRIIYTSPIARAQEQTEANGIMRSLQVLAPFMEMKPTIMDNFNEDELAQGVLRMFSVNEAYLNDPRVIQAERQRRLEMQQNEAMAKNAQMGGQGFNQIAQGMTQLQEAE